MFEELFPEFLATYLATSDGQTHLAHYAYMRQTARANYQAIVACAAQNEDSTALILQKLLPHTDSPANRQHGYWVHPSSAINGDLRHWHERAGWTQSHQWAAVTTAILDFISDCITDPQQLDHACQNFTELTYVKGFQTATLSPILNALQPTAFALLNHRSRRVLNHLALTNFTAHLQDYPAANRRYQLLMDEITPSMQQMAKRTLDDAAPLDLFDMFCHWLVTIKKFDFRGTRYWRLALDDQAQPASDAWWQREWLEWQEGGFAALDGDLLGDISQLKRTAFNRLRDQMLAQSAPEWTQARANQIWTFAHKLREGDRIAVHTLTQDGQRLLLGMGTVIAPYYFVPNTESGHCVPIEWEETRPRLLPKAHWSSKLTQIDHARFGMLNTGPVIELPEKLPEQDALPEAATQYGEQTSQPRHVAESIIVYNNKKDHQPLPAYPLAACAEQTGFDEHTLARWIKAIERKGQIILYGPPGTGKTYMAEQLARHLVASESTSEFTSQDGFYDLIQFHPTYAYEDFIQGIRPYTLADGSITYRLTPGYFLEFCQRAAQCQDVCVLIIDEINRANLTRVFGELMYLLEYRDRAVSLAGGGEPLEIPNNVRIIGTMNTADRSIAVVDYALRRRFAFIEMAPDYEILRRWHRLHSTDLSTSKLIEPLIALLQRLNAQIGDSHYALGTAFFLRPSLSTELQDIWEMEIEPYLEEYFFDQPEVVAAWRWSSVVIVPN